MCSLCDIYDVCCSYLKNLYDICRYLRFVVDVEIDVVTFVVEKRQLRVLWHLWRLSSRHPPTFDIIYYIGFGLHSVQAKLKIANCKIALVSSYCHRSNSSYYAKTIPDKFCPGISCTENFVFLHIKIQSKNASQCSMITIHTAMYIDYINVHVGIEPTFYHIHPSEQIRGGNSH